MTARSLAKLQRQVAGLLSKRKEPHGHGTYSDAGIIKGVDIDDSGAVKMAIQPARAHCPCCLVDLSELRNIILAKKGVNSVHIEVIGIPASDRWTKAVNE